MDAAACIGCGACVAMCPNAAAALLTGAKIMHLGALPQGQPERYRRAVVMVAQANHEMFGNCGNIGECEAVYPKDIKLEVIAHEPGFLERGGNRPRRVTVTLRPQQEAIIQRVIESGMYIR